MLERIRSRIAFMLVMKSMYHLIKGVFLFLIWEGEYGLFGPQRAGPEESPSSSTWWKALVDWSAAAGGPATSDDQSQTGGSVNQGAGEPPVDQPAAPAEGEGNQPGVPVPIEQRRAEMKEQIKDYLNSFLTQNKKRVRESVIQSALEDLDVDHASADKLEEIRLVMKKIKEQGLSDGAVIDTPGKAGDALYVEITNWQRQRGVGGAPS